MLQPARTSEPIPGYVVADRLGVGGYGEVWSAQAPGGVPKAIKFVYGYFDDERAKRELKALNRIKQVRHPFLLSLERFEIIDGQLIIVTELAEMSLKDRFEQVRETGPSGIPREELLGYLRDAADALDYMSENFSLQHLDVKPENLLLVGGRVKVADFGLVKEIHDVNASMMGGLTPIYAPPEVFDGQPSRHSDQYSLAIVYQEMLTGSLPFPGRTAAQLTSQHLHARPRLTNLSPTDQTVILRALAKDPQQRFASCRALIDALLAADAAPQCSPVSPNRKQNSALDASSDTTSIKSKSAETNTDWQRSHGGNQGPARQRTPSVKTQIINGAEAPAANPTATPAPRLIQPIVDLAPIDATGLQTGLRPTLFIGIGGTASRTLKQLGRRLRDRLGPAAAVPALQMLVLDTDSKNICQITQGERETALTDDETMSLPLRNAHDYATDSRNILQWLSRRWLYNIPRSLQTEGRRPLGRLALVDHSQQVWQRLRKALATITSAEAIAATLQATGIGFRTQVPRVFLVSSISGGTGGGMVLDVAYAVRMILADLGLSDEGVCGILTHSTDRNLAARDLMIANAYACLSELQHYSAPGHYPGEPACGIPAFEPDSGPFPSTYFVHLGDDLTDQAFDAATDRLSTYLYLDAVTSAGAVFDKCREAASASADEQPIGPALRTFGLMSIGSSQSPLAAMATEQLCKDVVDRWCGTHRHLQNEPAAKSIEDLTRQAATPCPKDTSGVEELAADHFGRSELDVETLCRQFEAILQNELGGDAEMICGKLRESMLQRDRGSARKGGNVAPLMAMISHVFGPPTMEADGRNAPVTPLRSALKRESEDLAATRGGAIRDWILELAENPSVRIGGAWRAKDWYASHLRGLETLSSERLRELQHHLQALTETLLKVDDAAPARLRIFGGRGAEKPAAEVDAAILQVVRLRFEELALHAACKMFRALSVHVSAAADLLKDLKRELERMSLQFDDRNCWEDADREAVASNVFDDAKTLTARDLRVRMAELVQMVDECFQSQFLEPQGGLRKVCQQPDAMRSTVPAALRAVARAKVTAALRKISIARAVLGLEATPEVQAVRLQACLEVAAPKLTGCGGSQRVIAILPESSAESPLQAAVSKLEPPPTVIRDADAELVFCHEVQELPLCDVAARLIEDRDDFVQIASKLHTRVDIDWSDVPQAVPHLQEIA